MADQANNEKPGIAFEKLVAAIQAKIDPASSVMHNEILVDRHGHERQFDVVMRGSFAGQAMLGVIECKDLKRKVGTPDVDAFVTKASDVNANVKIVMSRSGFSKPALEKCAHYGIKALSLIQNDPINKNFFIGTRCTADVKSWGKKLYIRPHFVNPTDEMVETTAENFKINNKRVIDGFANYTLDRSSELPELGWIEVVTEFSVPQVVELKPGVERLCKAISVIAERTIEQLEYRAVVTGEGFFNWNAREATFAPGSTFIIEPFPMDFSLWKPRSDQTWPKSGFIEMHLEISCEFDRVSDALDLDAL